MDSNAAILSQQPTANSQEVNHVLVSIIIPAYNTGEYIHRAIESSLRQTHKNVEVIVVDDGSEDNTLEVAKSYAEKDSRLRVFHKENGGVSSARNMGIREAHGEYIVFLDSDDWLELNAIEILIGAQMKYPDKLIAFRAYAVAFNPNCKDSFQRIMYNYNSTLQSKILKNLDECIYAYPTSAFLCASSVKFFTTGLIRKYNLSFREDIYYGEDQLFNFDYLCHVNGMFFLNIALLNVLMRLGSAMHVSYNDRKIFVDGKIKNYVKIMIDSTENSKVLKALKWYNTYRFHIELADAFKSENTELWKINAIRKKMRMYTHEYIVSTKISFIKKLDFLCGAYLPIPLARFTMLAMRYVNDTIKAFKNRNKKEEILPYW